MQYSLKLTISSASLSFSDATRVMNAIDNLEYLVKVELKEFTEVGYPSSEPICNRLDISIHDRKKYSNIQATGERIRAIKECRMDYKLGLKEAKLACDEILLRKGTI